MKTKIFIILIALIFPILTFGQQEAITNDGKKVLLFEDKSWVFSDSLPLYYIKPSQVASLEIPAISPKDKIIRHTGYSFLFDDKCKQAKWVAYELTDEKTKGIYTRFDKFIVDPLVKKGTANDKDYIKCGFDRGHLAPAADMLWSLQTMKESFYYSNISPQDAEFNRGIWKRLEELARNWAVENKDIYIVTGPVLSSSFGTIGNNKVAVPKYFYKVILDYSEPDIKGIGFILPNESSGEPLQKYAVSIDSVESFTGINFFPQLPKDQEEIIEKTLAINSWSWKNSNSNDDQEKLGTSVQCQGTTKAGTRCKNKTLNPSGYCYLHEDQTTGVKQTVKNESKTTNTYSSGIQTGPRGGKYYINKNGNKTYVRRK